MSAKISNTMKGVPKSEEHRLAVIKALEGKVKNGCTGKLKYTNGVESHYFIEGTQPAGYELTKHSKGRK